MSGEIFQSVAYDNYDDFQHVNFIFSQNFISLFWELFNNETDLRVRVTKLFSCEAGKALLSRHYTFEPQSSQGTEPNALTTKAFPYT